MFNSLILDGTIYTIITILALISSVFEVVILQILVLAACIYLIHSFGIFGWTDFAFILKSILIYLSIGLICSFANFYFHARKASKYIYLKKKEYNAYLSMHNSEDKKESFENYYNSQLRNVGSGEYYLIDFKTQQLAAIDNQEIAVFILLWWAKIIRLVLKDFLIFVIDKCKNIYGYISYLAIRNALKS